MTTLGVVYRRTSLGVVHRWTSLCSSLRLSKMRRLLAAKGSGAPREHFGGTFRSIVWQAEMAAHGLTGN
jgi:hypothetical protein